MQRLPRLKFWTALATAGILKKGGLEVLGLTNNPRAKSRKLSVFLDSQIKWKIAYIFEPLPLHHCLK